MTFENETKETRNLVYALGFFFFNISNEMCILGLCSVLPALLTIMKTS